MGHQLKPWWEAVGNNFHSGGGGFGEWLGGGGFFWAAFGAVKFLVAVECREASCKFYAYYFCKLIKSRYCYLHKMFTSTEFLF